MTVSAFVADDRFIYRITKYLSTNPSNKWANSYEFVASAVGGETELLQVAEVLVDFEAEFHLSQVVFDRVLVSTWEEDSKPYDPDVFISSTLTATGGIAGGGQLQALDTCLSLARIASSGRFGHIFYRACLEELDIGAPAGIAVLIDRAAQQAKIDAALASSGLDNFVGSAAAGNLKMCMVNKAGDQTRLVQQLRVQGVSKLPTDHAWFNRTTSP